MLPRRTALSGRVLCLAALGPFAALGFFTGCGKDAHPGSLASDGSIDLPPVADIPFPPLDENLAPQDGSVDGGTAEAGGMDAPDTATDAPASDRPADAAPDAARSPFCSFTPDQMDQLAVRIASCTGQAPQPMLEQFYRPEQWEGGPFAARPCDVLRCAADAHTCTDALSLCLKYVSTPVAGGGVCPGPSPRCDGHSASHCENSRIISDDCEAVGGRCVASSTEAACAPTSGSPCSTSASTRCNGTVAERCVAGVYIPTANCALTASRCDPTAGACVGTGGACTGDASACDGTALRRCIGGHYQTLDCGLLVQGATCQTAGGAAFCGTASTCDPAASPAGGRCDGNTVVLCAGGHALRFDCMANGFTGCGSAGCRP